MQPEQQQAQYPAMQPAYPLAPPPGVQYADPNYPMAIAPPMGASYPVPMISGHPYPDNAMKALEYINSIWITQKAQYLEAFLGCEFENKYRVYGTEGKGKSTKRDKNDKLFKCREHSGCCQRYCLPGSMREFTMDIDFNICKFDPVKGRFKNTWTPFLQLRRDYSCTFMCCNRPVIKVIKIDEKDPVVLGYVIDEWACFDYTFWMKEKMGDDPFYKVRANCCQCGFCMTCPCDRCTKVTFDILDGSNKSVVGDVSKVSSGCCKECFTNADSYCVRFPISASSKYKALLMACTLFIDYRYFEEKNNGKAD